MFCCGFELIIKKKGCKLNRGAGLMSAKALRPFFFNTTKKNPLWIGRNDSHYVVGFHSAKKEYFKNGTQYITNIYVPMCAREIHHRDAATGRERECWWEDPHKVYRDSYSLRNRKLNAYHTHTCTISCCRVFVAKTARIHHTWHDFDVHVSYKSISCHSVNPFEESINVQIMNLHARETESFEGRH